VPSLDRLRPDFRPFAEALLKYARSIDPRFVITSAWRSHTEQAQLYSKWLKGQSPFPALPPGKSSHELGLAVDMARLGIDAATDEVLAAVGAEWRKAGGHWPGPLDPVHFSAPLSWQRAAGNPAAR
jgi:LAS superfamily LD-carboxypeptidase LdcB